MLRDIGLVEDICRCETKKVARPPLLRAAAMWLRRRSLPTSAKRIHHDRGGHAVEFIRYKPEIPGTALSGHLHKSDKLDAGGYLM